MKIHRVRAELFHAHGRTDDDKEGQTYMTMLIVTFRNFASDF
jgi:hypothetical protein